MAEDPFTDLEVSTLTMVSCRVEKHSRFQTFLKEDQDMDKWGSKEKVIQIQMQCLDVGQIQKKNGNLGRG